VAEPHELDPGNPERRKWLENLAAACERVLAREEGDPSDSSYGDLRQDVQDLLARVRAELDGRTTQRAKPRAPD
jgi:ElaB/YqjD/DUF883 family membrane-anchored ribosome-binding protein